MNAPVLGLIVDRPPSPELAGLLVELKRWCRPSVDGANVGSVAAWLATSPRIARPDDRPFAVWVDDGDDATGLDATVFLTPLRSGTRNVAEPATFLVPERMGVPADATLDLAATPPLTPFVRRRWRTRSGLPGTLVVEMTDDSVVANGTEVPEDLEATTLALASAVSVVGDRLVAAMAWGAACVTDAASAAAVGADARDEVLVAEDAEERRRLCAELADDDHRAAALGRRARRLLERTRSARRVAMRLVRLLELDGGDPGQRMSLVLDELETPVASRVRDRAGMAMAALGGQP